MNQNRKVQFLPVCRVTCSFRILIYLLCLEHFLNRYLMKQTCVNQECFLM